MTYKNAHNVLRPPEQRLGSARLSDSFEHLACRASLSVMNFLTGALRHRPAVWLLANPTQHGSAYRLWPSASLRLASSASLWCAKERDGAREELAMHLFSRGGFQLFRWLPQHLCSLIFPLLTPRKSLSVRCCLKRHHNNPRQQKVVFIMFLAFQVDSV